MSAMTNCAVPTGSPFQIPGQSPQGWHHLQGYGGTDSPSFANLNGIMSPQSPFGFDGIQQAESPGFMHGRQQSLQYPILAHQQSMRNSPRLQEVREDDEDLEVGEGSGILVDVEEPPRSPVSPRSPRMGQF